MSTISIKEFAKQIGVEPKTLVSQLAEAGVKGKRVGDNMSDEEKRSLLTHLRGDMVQTASSGKITLKRKTTSEIRQKSRTGTTRTVQVEVRKRRTFVAREVLEKQEQDRVAAIEAEREAEETIQREAEEAVKREQQEKERAEQEAEEAVVNEKAKEKVKEQQEKEPETADQVADAPVEPKVEADESADETDETKVETCRRGSPGYSGKEIRFPKSLPGQDRREASLPGKST